MDRDSHKTSALLTWIGGAALGAMAMYLTDPDRGKRRRALAKDKVQSLMTQTGNAMDVASRDFSNRMQGLRAQTNRLLTRRRGEVIDDDILEARVRSKIGRAISHPHAIKVRAEQGHVALSGPILPNETMALLAAARAVHGVISVTNNTEVHEQQDVPSLQGEGRHRQQARPLIMQENWPPALRAAAAVGGGLLGAYGLARRSPRNMLLLAAGMGLVARGVANKPLSRMTGRETFRQPLQMEKSIYIAAPRETVFDIWSNYEHFPRFMSHVKEVKDLGNGRSHWVVSGPAGRQLEWDAAVTRHDRASLLAWETEPHSMIEHSGSVSFEPEQDGTRIKVQMSYTPAGAIGRAAASLFNGDPARQLEEDLIRMKSYIESSRAPRDAMRTAEQSGQLLH
jgi:uncharacterized membrane protein/osmotically-inducible protein OsmY